MRQSFMKVHYTRFLEVLLDALNVDFIASLPKGSTSILIDVFFLYGYHEKAFYVLTSTVNDR